MNPELPAPDAPPPLNGRRRALIMGVALLSDAIGIPAEPIPPLMICIDAITAVILFWLAGKPKWLIPVLIAECIPWIGVFPFWSLAAMALILKPKST